MILFLETINNNKIKDLYNKFLSNDEKKHENVTSIIDSLKKY